jgi:hypothetical protein
MTATSTIIAAAFIIGSTAYQVQQQKKMRKKLKAAEEARKGFEMVVEGEVYDVPIVYGRAKVGGARVWHNIRSSHVGHNGITNADMTFDVGLPPESGGTVLTSTNSLGEFIAVEVPPSDGSLLSVSRSGSKNEFLYFQQVLCHGPINGIYDFVVDESRFADDPTLGTKVDRYLGHSLIGKLKIKAAFRSEVHYDGGEANTLIVNNFGDRKDAKFHGLAYANTVIRLNRDDPQFHGQAPMVQYFIEGRKVRTVANGLLSEERVYSNNPAWCLLDYLLHASDRAPLFDSGKSISLEELDLASFEAGAAICDRIVLTDKALAGSIWKPISETRHVEYRDVPLYECNVIVDTAKPIRDNVEMILSTMGDARLVWSAGKYKLSIQYPANNESVVLAEEITDDDLVEGTQVELTWPGSDSRFNRATVRFHNESENFKEDTVSWPPKLSDAKWIGIGGYRYPAVSDGKGLLGTYGVWSGTSGSATLTWKYRAVLTSQYTFEFQASGGGSITIYDDATNIEVTSHQRFNDDKGTWQSNLSEGTVYRIVIVSSGTNISHGVAARISVGPLAYWTTRDPAYDHYREVVRSDDVYASMLSEDHGVELENSVFADGVVDYYHALAKCEEIVRTSRSALNVSFSYLLKSVYLEPGDFIRLSSETLGLTDGILYVRVNEVRYTEEGICEVTGTRFDWTQLAWNVADDEYILPANLYDFEIPPPYNVTYDHRADSLLNSAGTLYWSHDGFDGLLGFIVYMNNFGELNADGELLFHEIGRSVENRFVLPAITIESAIFGVVAYTKSGRHSQMAISGLDAIFLNPGDIKKVELHIEGAEVFTEDEYGNISPDFIYFYTVIHNFHNPVYEWYVDDILQAITDPVIASNAISFDVQWRLAGSGTNLGEVTNVETFSFDLTELDPDLTYAFRVRSFDGEHWSEWSYWYAFKVSDGELVRVQDSYFILPAFNDVAAKTVRVVVREGITSVFAMDSRTVFLDSRSSAPYMEIPPTPEDLEVSGGLNALYIKWKDPMQLYGNHFRTRIFRSYPMDPHDPTPSFETGEWYQVALVEGSFHVDDWFVEDQTRYCYWIAFVSQQGVQGPVNAINGTCAVTAVDPVEALQTLDAWINEDHFVQSLRDRIDLIDGPSSLSGSVNQRIAEVQAQLENFEDIQDFDPNADYYKGDVVRYDGGIYVANMDMTAPSAYPTNTSYWTKIGDYATLAEALSAHAQWLATHQAWIDEKDGVITAHAQQISVLETGVESIEGELLTKATKQELVNLESSIYGSEVTSFTQIHAEFNHLYQTIEDLTGIELQNYATITYVDDVVADMEGAFAFSMKRLEAVTSDSGNVLPDGNFHLSVEEGTTRPYYSGTQFTLVTNGGYAGGPGIRFDANGTVKATDVLDGTRDANNNGQLFYTPVMGGDTFNVSFTAYHSSNFSPLGQRFRVIMYVTDRNHNVIEILSAYAESVESHRSTWTRYSVKLVVATSGAPAYARFRLNLNATATSGYILCSGFRVEKMLQSSLEITEQVSSVMAQWEIKSDVNGLVGGVGFYNDGEKVVFAVVANQFAILPPAGFEDVGQPFYYLTTPIMDDDPDEPSVLVPAGMYLNSAAIANLSITTAMIEEGFLNFLSAKHGRLSLANINIVDFWDVTIGGVIEGGDLNGTGPGWQITRAGDATFKNVNVNDGDINGGRIIGSLISGATIVATKQVRPTTANPPLDYYTHYASVLRLSSAGSLVLTAHHDKNYRVFNAYSGILNWQPYNAGPSGVDNVEHFYDNPVEITLDFEAWWSSGSRLASSNKFEVWVYWTNENGTDRQLLFYRDFRNGGLGTYVQNGIMVWMTSENETCYDDGYGNITCESDGRLHVKGTFPTSYNGSNWNNQRFRFRVQLRTYKGTSLLSGYCRISSHNHKEVS